MNNTRQIINILICTKKLLISSNLEMSMTDIGTKVGRAKEGASKFGRMAANTLATGKMVKLTAMDA